MAKKSDAATARLGFVFLTDCYRNWLCWHVGASNIGSEQNLPKQPTMAERIG
jgi:hypothetical protein